MIYAGEESEHMKYEGEDGTGLAMCLERTGTMIVW